MMNTREGIISSTEQNTAPAAAIPEMVGLSEAVKRLNAAGLPVGYALLRRLCLEGKLIHIRLGRRFYLNWSALVEYCNRGGSFND